MRIRYVKPFELPEWLLKQKKGWNLDVFYRMAHQASDIWMSFMLEKDGEDIGCFIAYDDELFDTIATQTLIVDKAHRDEDTVTEATRLVYKSLKRIANKFGRHRIAAEVMNPDRFMSRLGNPPGLKTGEVVIMEEL